ncbi:MAG: CheR family methyltransferase [Prochloraceae cyanobacterium]
MKNSDCVKFLKTTLPELQLRWPGFRRVQRQVCRRLKKRLKELGLTNFENYRSYLFQHPDEWSIVDSCCRITISRFYRDREVFAQLSDILPRLVKLKSTSKNSTINCWSIGCASGEEVYTLKLIEHFCLSSSLNSLDILATDLDRNMLSRAKLGCYQIGSLKELPLEWIDRAFFVELAPSNKDKTIFDYQYYLKPIFKEKITWKQQDIRKQMPNRSFDLILCRNLAFTYFAPILQEQIQKNLLARLVSEGILVIGQKESLPNKEVNQLIELSSLGIYQKL